ncbi:hypothetical protein FN976_06495 [Caenimonas sedimenti]|uniref:Uncharacterized protein n=1 Tax=Caenimonas sedimenti TaxID=2596921 RepID=A0A562ZVD4_9BURK|nr:hypothetical protein FN976_06495 [Caenimonas sedimenti]
MRTRSSWLYAFVLATGVMGVQAQSLPGDYVVEGRDFDGKAYTGKLRITAAGPVFRLAYTEDRTLRGMGIQRGNQLFTAWGPNSKCTVSALEIKADGNLEGPWGDLERSALGSESLSKQAGAPGQVDGTYTSRGRTPDGESYDGVTTIEARGQVFKVNFKDNDGNQPGVAIRQGQSLAVAYGGSRCGVSVYTINADGTLAGPYADPRDNRLGTETIRRR